jgi:Beta-lactamase
MKGLAVLFIAVIAVLPTASGEKSPSAARGAVSASHDTLSREAVVPLTAVTRVFPVITQEISTGQNSTAAGQPTATRSVVYANSDNSKKVTISVDQYASPGDALGAYEEAVQKSRSVPGFNPIAAPNLGPHTFMGSVTPLSRETLQKMFTVPTVAGPAHTHYASGWFVEPSGVLWHAGTLAGYGTNNMLVPATGYGITLLSNTPQNDRWKPADVALEMYNAASLGPKLPPLIKRVRTTLPH